MTRDVARLGTGTFDLLVIGGGIYGAIVAADAAQRGLSVALVERDDFGSGNTFNHLRTVHGGLRYLQHLDIRRARESVLERRTLARIAPWFVRPVAFVLPLTARLLRGPLMMRAGFLLDAMVAADRNAGVPDTHRLPAGRVISAGEARARHPWLQEARLTGAAVWYDYVVTESDRLSLAWVGAAFRHGAVTVNHAAATGLLRDGSRVVGARVVDALTGGTTDVSARMVVNATGGDLDGLLAPERAATGLPLLRAMNLVTRLPGGDAALGGQAASGRALFMVPWQGRALFGTWESASPCQPPDRMPAAAEIDAFVAEVAAAFPAAGLARHDVTLVHRGVVPAVVDAQGRATLEGRQQVRDHATDRQPLEGLISVAGTKFTTARAVAEQIVDLVASRAGTPTAPCRTAISPLPLSPAAGTRPGPPAAVSRSWPPDVGAHLAQLYGEAQDLVGALADTQPELAERLSEASPTIGAQIAWAARHEMAMTLMDAIVRRTTVGALGHPGRAAITRAARILAVEHHWPPDRLTGEITAVEAFYRL